MVYPSDPFLGTALAHVSHGPLDFCLFVRELVWTQPDVRLASIDKTSAFQAVAIEGWRKGRFEVVTDVSGNNGSGSGSGYGCRLWL